MVSLRMGPCGHASMGPRGLGAAVSQPLSLAYRFIVALRIRAPYNSIVCFVNVDYTYFYDV